MAISTRQKLDAVYVPTAPDLRPDKDGKLPAVTLSTLRTFLTTLATRLNGLLSFGQAGNGSWAGNVDGQFLRVTPQEANVRFPVPHGLERVPVGYIITRRNSASVLYDNGGGDWTDTTLYLYSTDAGIEMTILVF